MSVGGIALAGATELFPEVNEQLKLVAFPSAVSLNYAIKDLISYSFLTWHSVVPGQVDILYDSRLWCFLSY